MCRPTDLSTRNEPQQEAIIESRHGKTIEQVFAKLKALLRMAAARTKEALWATIGTLLDAFTPDECVNYLANCGYDPV